MIRVAPHRDPELAVSIEAAFGSPRSPPEIRRRFLVAELQTLATELEELTRSIERSSPAHLEPGAYRTSAA